MLSPSLIIPSDEFAACVKIIVSYNQLKQQLIKMLLAGKKSRKYKNQFTYAKSVLVKMLVNNLYYSGN